MLGHVGQRRPPREWMLSRALKERKRELCGCPGRVLPSLGHGRCRALGGRSWAGACEEQRVEGGRCSRQVRGQCFPAAAAHPSNSPAVVSWTCPGTLLSSDVRLCQRVMVLLLGFRWCVGLGSATAEGLSGLLESSPDHYINQE